MDGFSAWQKSGSFRGCAGTNMAGARAMSHGRSPPLRGISNKGRKTILKGACRRGQNEPASSPSVRLAILRIAAGERVAPACSGRPHDALARSP